MHARTVAIAVFALALCALVGAAVSGESELTEALDVSALEQQSATLLAIEQDRAEAEAVAEAAAEDEGDADESEDAADAEDAEDSDEAADEAESAAEAEQSFEDEASEESAAESRFRAAVDEMAVGSLSAGAVEFEEESDEATEAREDAEAFAEEETARFAQRSTGAPAGAQYNEALAKDAIVYSQAAYYPSDHAACAHALGHRTFEVAHQTSQDMFDGSTLFGFTAVDKAKSRIIVAFHGDVKANVLAKRLWKGKPIKVKKLCKSCKTHKYFALVNSKICPEMIASTKQLTAQYPAFEVLVTGHGMGGAMASLCAYEMEMARAFTRTNKREFISFGAPRSGNCHWARKFNQIFPNAVRVTHANDPITRIAPCHADPATQRCIEIKDRKKRLWAYHFPTQVWYSDAMPHFGSSKSGAFTVCRGANWGEDESCRTHPLGFSMADHRNYFGVDVVNHCKQTLEKKL